MSPANGDILKYAVLRLARPGNIATYQSNLPSSLRHPACAWLGLRPVLAQHTAEEHALLERWAKGRSSIVEIGVAEGVSAIALRENMDADGTLYLIDPFHLSRFPLLNFTKRAAHRAVHGSRRGRIVWIEQFSFDAVRGWKQPIDLLLIDGDHSENGVRRDWEQWSPFVVPGGIVIFHDARLFEAGWTSPNYGPVRLVDELFRTQNTSDWNVMEEMHSILVVERSR
jgi:predicted O-methyltransferase YrrM